MSDYERFKHGAVTFPVPPGGSGIGGAGGSFLRDADPALFYVLEFYAFVINRYVGARLLSEAMSVGADQIVRAVQETIPFNPESFLTEDQLGFPLLAAYRKSSKFEDIGGAKHSVDDIDVVYVLPPMMAGEAERLMPVLKAVTSIIDNRTEQGMDPNYTPTGGTLGQHVWALAGVASAGIKGAQYGGYAVIDEKTFPAVILSLELKEKSDVAVEDFEDWTGFAANIDLKDPAQQTVVSDVVQVLVEPAPTVTLAVPNNGTKLGGTSVTLTGTNFRVGTCPRVFFGNVEATSVVVVSATTLTCVTPAHDAFTTFPADVIVENLDGQSGTLIAGFTFTTP